MTRIVAEIGINHNGNLEIAKKLIDVAVIAGCDVVKFQKRTPELCVPEHQRSMERDTPWGRMTYMDYRRRVEFGAAEYDEIDRYCQEKDIAWFASVWDLESLDFIDRYDVPYIKIPSAMLTHHKLLKAARSTGRTVIMSTGMSTMQEIEDAVEVVGESDLILMHCTSAYPCDPTELNLSMIHTLKKQFICPIGYSGHETGLVTTAIAVAFGAEMVERHITLDRAMWGSDQAASVEPQGLTRLVKYIRVTEQALGDGVKKVFDSEIPIREKLRI